jgi:hypothetical protein
LTATVDPADGAFTFAETFDVGAWDLEADVEGWGFVTGSFTVTADAITTTGTGVSADADAVTATLDLVPRNITVTITADDGAVPTPAAVTSWTADVDGTAATKTVSSITFVEAGKTTYSVVVREPNSFRSAAQTVDLLTATETGAGATKAWAAALTATLYPAPEINGEVARSGQDSNITLTLAAGACPSSSTPTASAGPTSGNGEFAFGSTTFDTSGLAFDPAATNTYCISAVHTDGDTGTIGIVFVVNASGVVTGSTVESVPADDINITAIIDPATPPPP